MKTIERRWTFDEWLEYLEDTAADPSYDSPSQQHEPEQRWDFNTDYSAAMTLARTGWPEGREWFAGKILEAVEAGYGMARTIDFSTDVAGYYPLMALKYAGEPAYMLTVEEGEQAIDAVVQIEVSLGITAKSPARSFQNWGAALCLLVDNVESQGRAVELTGVFYSTGHKNQNKFRCEIVLKQSGEPMDMDRMAFAISHPATHRRLKFRTIESIGELYYGEGSQSMGSSCAPPKFSDRVLHSTWQEAGPVIQLSGVEENRLAARGLESAIERVQELFEAEVERTQEAVAA